MMMRGRVHLLVGRARSRKAVATGACCRELSLRSPGASRSASDPTRYSRNDPFSLLSLSVCLSGCQPLCFRSYKVQQKLSLFTIVVVSVSFWGPAALNWILQRTAAVIPFHHFRCRCWSGCQPLGIRSYKVQQQLSPFNHFFVISVVVWVPAVLHQILQGTATVIPFSYFHCQRVGLDSSRFSSDPTTYSSSYPLQLFSLSACWSGCQPLFVRSYKRTAAVIPFSYFRCQCVGLDPSRFASDPTRYRSNYPLQLSLFCQCVGLDARFGSSYPL